MPESSPKQRESVSPCPISRLVLAGLVLAFAAGLALRFSALSRQSYWYDEMNGIRIAWRPYVEILQELEADASPPFYYFSLHPWLHLFGDSEASTRAFSALFGALLLPCILLAGRRLFDARTGTIAMALAAGAHVHIYYSQEARMYAMLALFALLSMLSHHQAWQHGRRTAWGQCVLWTVLAMYTHNYGVFIALAGGVYGLSCWRQQPDRRPAFVCALLLTGSLYLPWFFFACRYQFAGTAITGGWLPRFRLSHLLETATSLSGVRLVGNGSLVYWVALVGLAAYVACWANALGMLKPKTDGRASLEGCSPPGSGLRIAALYFLIPLVIPMLVSVVKPIFLPHRYSMAAWPACVLLAAFGLKRIRYPVLRKAVMAAIAVNMVLSMLWHFGAEVKAPDREVAAAIADRLEARDCIIYSPHWAGVTFSHYLRNRPHQLGFPARALAERAEHNEARERETRSLEDVLTVIDTEMSRLGGRVFLVRTRWEPKGRDLRDALDQRLQLVERQGFHETMEVSLYTAAQTATGTGLKEME